MLSSWDDFPLHQDALPILQPVDGDPTRYDRYFFHGYDVDAGAIFVVALGIYPNREIIDAAFVISQGGAQRSVFASGRLDAATRRTEVGPIRVEVIEPMRTLRVVVDAPEQGLAADVTFTARSVPVLEPRQRLQDRLRVVMDTCRFTQFGGWDGTMRSGEDDFVVRDWDGTRDRSWGIRPLAGATPAAPATGGQPGIFWAWAPVQFPSRSVHVALSEAPDGLPTLVGSAAVARTSGDDVLPESGGLVTHARDVQASFAWIPGTRVARRASFRLVQLGGRDDLTVDLEPVAKVFMRGAGYLNFDWQQGAWHDEVAVGGERLVHGDLDPATDFTLLHVQHVCRVTSSLGEQGVGVLEHLVIGPHLPSGFADIMDGAPEVET